MQTKGRTGLGRFSVEFEVANYGDVVRAMDGTLAPNKVRREVISGVVDPGAAKLVLPKEVAKRLGLPIQGKIKVRYADGRRAVRDDAKGVYVEILGRNDTFSAIVEPKRKTALIGAVVLEVLDLLVDCQRQRLIPRDPSGPIYEVE
jgi:predicted aspartyl protease